ncbi:MAG: SH3 domain-containing protein [Byssovorax sp.]
MGKTDRPLAVEIPRAGSEHPAWSRVGAIGLCGFLIGIAWPRIAGVRIGPSVPGDLRAQIEATASPTGSAAPRASAAASSAPAPSGSATVPMGSAAPSADAAVVPANQELVVVGAGKITKCFEKKDKKIEDCEKLLFDPIAVPRLRELAKCSSALGLEGKMTIGFEVNFEKKEIQVAKAKKVSGMPSTTVNGILQCAAHEFGNASLEEVPHKYRRYTLAYSLNFYKPGKHPGATDGGADAGDGGENAAGATTSETEATGNAVIASDSVSLRKEAKGKEKVGRLVRGTKVKILAKQNDWYKVESGSNVGWVYRTAIGL